MIAEIPIEPARGWEILGVIILLLNGAIAWKSFFGGPIKHAIEPNPLIVKGAEQFALKHELDEVKGNIRDIEGQLTGIHAQIGSVKDALSSEASRRSANLHQRIDGLQQQMGSMQGEMKHVGNMVEELLKKELAR